MDEQDLKSFEELYRENAGFVYNVAFRVVGNKEDAEEVTQEVFLTVHDKLKDFLFESSFRTWVYRITVNLSINYIKKVSKERNRNVEYEPNMQTQATVNQTEEQINKAHHEQVVQTLLQALNPDQRACVVLRNIEGLSYEQIADTLKININTVRSRLKRARETLLALKKEVLQ